MAEDDLVPPLADGEYIHFEYLHFDPEDAETGFSNYVEISHDRRMAGDKAAKLIADPKVWAIHIRRYEQPEQGVHLYDETQHLAVAQNKAYAEHKRAEVLQQLLGAAVGGACEMDTKHQRTIARLEKAVETVVAEALASRERDHGMDPDRILELLAPDRLQALVERLCTKCGENDEAHILWAKGHLPKWPEDIPEKLVRTIAGTEHEHRYVGQRTIDDSSLCTVEGCNLPYNSAKLYDDQVKLDAMRARVEGESAQDTTEAEQSPDDICVCGCPRKVHQGTEGLGGAQCRQCPGDSERSWRHAFRLAVL